ncbi:MAG: biotin synthase BioB, partial [Spirochaetes bacterium]|nr:biotin synthase BioB [Spirochaetota bacterium]
TTHSYADRKDTLGALNAAGVGLCSGLIVGMGESDDDIVEAAFALKDFRVISIPVNFFIPVPGHAVRNPRALTPEFCLRVLIMFRLIHPDSEIRIAAGREGHLRGLQSTALMVANSLFASGYLNVKGSNISETVALIRDAGYEPEIEGARSAPEGEPGIAGDFSYTAENLPRLLKFQAP